MNETDAQGWERWRAEHRPQLDAIRELIPGLSFTLHQIRHAGLQASAVVLPADLNPGKFDGDDATDAGSSFMGLPIVWGDRAGLVVAP